jgi:hypothetical protein
VWILRCLFRLDLWVNVFLHTSHEKGCSPVCILWCMIRFERWENLFLHTLHTNGRSPVWTLIWLSRLKRLVKLLLHTSQEKCRSRSFIPSIVLRCWVNNVTHVSQRDILSLPLAVRENFSLHISKESITSSLCNSDNSALCSPRCSLTLISLMKSAASVWVSLT